MGREESWFYLQMLIIAPYSIIPHCADPYSWCCLLLPCVHPENISCLQLNTVLEISANAQELSVTWRKFLIERRLSSSEQRIFSFVFLPLLWVKFQSKERKIVLPSDWVAPLHPLSLPCLLPHSVKSSSSAKFTERLSFLNSKGASFPNFFFSSNTIQKNWFFSNYPKRLTRHQLFSAMQKYSCGSVDFTASFLDWVYR